MKKNQSVTDKKVKKNIHKEILRELAIRGRYILPETEKEIDWFDEGTNLNKCPDFLKRLLNALEIK